MITRASRIETAYGIRANLCITRRDRRVDREVIRQRRLSGLSTSMVTYRRIQREHLLRRQRGIAHRRCYNNEIRVTTATTAKGIGKNQKITKTYRTIPV